MHVFSLNIPLRDYYVTKAGRLRRSENTVDVELADGSKRTIPINDIRSIHLFSEIDLNTRILIFLNQHGIPVHVYNYYGYYSGSFYPREKVVSGVMVGGRGRGGGGGGGGVGLGGGFFDTAIHNIVKNLEH